MSDLISPEYRQMQSDLHQAKPNYGVASIKFAPTVADLVSKLGVTRILDYGAGKGRLGTALKELTKAPLQISHYDPAIPEWSRPPQPEELVCCIDVLEHIEPDRLDAVLDDLRRVTARFGFFTVHTGVAKKVLPDGRNAHLIQQPAAWWLAKFQARFDIAKNQEIPDGFMILVKRKPPTAA